MLCRQRWRKILSVHYDWWSKQRTLYLPVQGTSSYSTVDFVKRAIIYFGYAPEIIQTDNGSEFTHTSKTKRIHPLDKLCRELHIIHKLIRPKTPWHNGKVERSHRNDQERFYNHLKFYSFDDLLFQMRRYLWRSNRIMMSVLGWKSPIEKRREIENARVVWLRSGFALPASDNSYSYSNYSIFRSHIIDKHTCLNFYLKMLYIINTSFQVFEKKKCL